MSYGYYQPYWINDENELEHFGIKGMKWGIRLYQNADGTLTEAGKKRYGSAENLQADRQKKKETAIKVAKTAAKIGVGVTAAILFANSGAARSASKTLDSIFMADRGSALKRLSIFTKVAESKVKVSGLNSESTKMLSEYGQGMIDRLMKDRNKNLWSVGQFEGTLDYLTKTGIYSNRKR